MLLRIAAVIAFFFHACIASGQPENSPAIVWQKCVELHRQGRLDSLQLDISYPATIPRQADSSRWFYMASDTFWFKDGIYSIGKRILDPFFEFHGCQVGEWQSFYPDGRPFSKGHYAIGAYAECQGGAPGMEGYSFRENGWTCWYPGGAVMATGIYRAAPKPIRVSGLPEANYSTANGEWVFFDECGNRIPPTRQLMEIINSDYYRWPPLPEEKNEDPEPLPAGALHPVMVP